MSISRLSSSPSPSFQKCSRAPEASAGAKASRCGSTQAGGPQAEQQLDAVVQQIQQLLKKLNSDGFDAAPKGAGSAGKRCGSAGGAGPAPQAAIAPESAPKAPVTKGAANADEVARQIAQDATNWKYDYSGGKSFDQAVRNEDTFDSGKAGVCTDMALEAAQRFEAKGVDARVVAGETDRGLHAWVEYKGEDGQYKRFDPTAATTKDASKAIDTDSNGYGYGKIVETYNDIPAEVPSL
ncbi:transglutaminase-like domain-containing protein [Archangium primigenium]|uniref:transglutaminase-like domain-containing protein n=1 Tax=[Archangium] primigenium TaxID=2792470 RepID=UPI00195ECDEF|nr:transglutaminase-like domain-containing protein [Archangium primigenium]MBM7116432.1 transglutaminase domain-containing protein [Archangium primigenium]